MKQYDVIVVGGGHGGAQTAIALRQRKFPGTIAIIGDEPDPPYERPPLSKDYLLGEKSFEKMLIRQHSFWETQQVDLLLGHSVVEVDPRKHAVQTADGRVFGYEHLVWSTGGAPRRLSCSGHDLAGIHAVRSRADVDRMLGELNACRQAVVVGGGYIGLESAAALVKLGKSVILLEALDRVLARVAGEVLAGFFTEQHRLHGVDIRLNTTVSCFEGRDGRVTSVRLADGTVVPADLAIVGIGITPAVLPLTQAGAAGINGVDVDAHCRTSLPDVYAIGDCAAHENRFADGKRIRLESVQNVNDQAIVAAKAILGLPEPYDSVPWFWSNQYDLRLQTVGIQTGHDHVVMRGEADPRGFSVVYLRQGRVVALDCVNSPREFMEGRGLVAKGISPDLAQLADRSTALKSFV
jgi:3-phenylpropionate/trans-cinnamate dioxygenase ferredoxin reductase subunit